MPELPCAFHSDRLTMVSCSHCERPICTDDMIPAPVGIQCPVCAGRMREGAIGEAAYRVRTKAESVPALRRISATQITMVLLALNVLWFLVIMAVDRGQSQATLIKYGSLVLPLPKTQLWRLFSSMFVHFGFAHLGFNMWALYVFGPPIENRYGKLRFTALYLVSGLLGGAASLAFHQAPLVAAGASGAVFGILGAWIAFFVRHRTAPGARDQLRTLAFIVGINLAFGFVSNVDNFAHLGGLVGGFALGSALEAAVRLKGRQATAAVLGAFLLVAGISIAMVLPKTCTPGTQTNYEGGHTAPCTLLVDGGI